MRCPKCHYLSFEPEPRCRNCGYDLAVPEADLVLRPAAESPAPLADLTLKEPPRVQSRRGPASLGLIHPADDHEPAAAVPARAAVAVSAPAAVAASAPAAVAEPVRTPMSEPVREFAARALPVHDVRVELSSLQSETPASPLLSQPARREPVRSPQPTTELPLFVKAMPPPELPPALAQPDAPLVSVPVEPRAPLGVRRSTVEPPKPRQKPAAAVSNRKLGPFDRDLLEDLKRVEKEEARQARAEARVRARAQGESAAGADAGFFARVFAAVIDITLLSAITAGIIWVTFRVTEVQPAEVGVDVFAPLAGFLLLVVFGYLTMFTAAGGQTVGKMITGIKVIGTPAVDAADDRLTLRQVAYREILTFPSLLPLGAGLLPALLGRGPAVHDRLAHTRVVRA
jgi:uncharacterized RDD family membrane protein YckC